MLHTSVAFFLWRHHCSTKFRKTSKKNTRHYGRDYCPVEGCLSPELVCVCAFGCWDIERTVFDDYVFSVSVLSVRVFEVLKSWFCLGKCQRLWKLGWDAQRLKLFYLTGTFPMNDVDVGHTGYWVPRDENWIKMLIIRKGYNIQVTPVIGSIEAHRTPIIK